MEWISVKDRLPEEWECCLITNKGGFVGFARYEHQRFADPTTPRAVWSDITHWMPLPAPPVSLKDLRDEVIDAAKDIMQHGGMIRLNNAVKRLKGGGG